MRIRLLTSLFDLYIRTYFPIKYAQKRGVVFGKNLHIYGKVNWGSEPWIITLGHNVYLTNNLTFITHDGGTLPLSKRINDLEITKPITIGHNAYIGVNCTILPGVTIGDNSIIGACSVVTKSIPSNCVAAGNPARPIKTFNEYIEKLERESLHLGNLPAEDKDKALRACYSEFLNKTRKCLVECNAE